MNWSGFGDLAAAAAAVTLAAVVLTFVVARLRRRYDTIDTLWGLGFALIAVTGFQLTSGASAVRLVATALTVVWGVRLAVHLHLRNHGRAEDPRYAAMVERGGHNPALRIFLRTYLVQALVLWFVSLPVLAAQLGGASADFGPTAWLGVVVWAVGFAFEVIGDEQLRRFRADPASAGKVLDTGLWRYTRHPNYFGDACVWWGLYLLAGTTLLGAATVLSPVLMTLLLARGTGKPMLEKGMRVTRPGYAFYVERTSGFVPLPPRGPATRRSVRR